MLEVYLSELGEPVGGPEWDSWAQEQAEALALALNDGAERQVSVKIDDIGVGADWAVIVAVFEGLMLIPEAPRRIQAVVEDMGKLYDWLKRGIQQLRARDSVVLHSPGFSMLNAIERLKEDGEYSEAVFLKHSSFPQLDRMPIGHPDAHLDQVFVFRVGDSIRMMIFNHSGALLHDDSVPVGSWQDS